jgi:acyl-CoA reductase-like NAD-dependent aldehyde dehydrogenase
VAPLYCFKDEGEAIQMANDTPTLTLPRSRGREGRGLAAYFYSRDIGIISIAPFGGGS